VLIEQAIDINTCWCLGISVLDAECLYLGSAIQLFDRPGHQVGNRVDPRYPVPDEAITIALAMRRLHSAGVIAVLPALILELRAAASSLFST